MRGTDQFPSPCMKRFKKTPPENVRGRGDQTLIQSMGLCSGPHPKKGWQASVMHWFVHTEKHDHEGCLHQIQETLVYLCGMAWFMSLVLKLGYWQVRMNEECKVYMAFTAGPLRFYKCEHIPFKLTYAPATFQCLMEICFGDSNWIGALFILMTSLFLLQSWKNTSKGCRLSSLSCEGLSSSLSPRKVSSLKWI